MDLAQRVAVRFAATKVLANLGIGETFENELWRVHRYSHSIRVTHLENAGRRGKKCVEWLVDTDGPKTRGGGESLAMEFMMLAKRKESLQRMAQAMGEAIAVGYTVHKGDLRGVDIKPGNFQKLFVRGALVTIEADYDSYQIRDITDDNNEPTCIAQGKKSIAQFYRWVKDNAQKLQSMSMHDIMTAMKQQGIEYHYYCAMD